VRSRSTAPASPRTTTERSTSGWETLPTRGSSRWRTSATVATATTGIPWGEIALARVEHVRRRHPSGIAELEARRVFRLPRALADDRGPRSIASTSCSRPSRGTRCFRVDLRIRLENAAAVSPAASVPDGRPAARPTATTYGVATRTTHRPTTRAGCRRRAFRTRAGCR
jgi:hypothetical protein